MLRYIVKPFYKFMTRLNYSSKFLVMIMLIAIPLSILATQQINNLVENLNDSKKHSIGLEALSKSHELIIQLELWRDLTVLRFLSSSPEIISLHTNTTNISKETINRVSELKFFGEDIQSVSFLKRIKTKVERPVVAPGMEGSSVEIVFDNMQEYINEAYDWQRSIASRFNLLSIRDPDLYLALNLILNDSNNLFTNIGKARTFGSYFLSKQYIDSTGISHLDKMYSSLEKEQQKLDIKIPTLIALINSTKATAPFTNPVGEILQKVDEHLIQTMDLTYYWANYFDEISLQSDNAKLLEKMLLTVIKEKLTHLEKAKYMELQIFVVLSLLVIVLITLLYIGFYTSVRNSIDVLVRSSEAVAAGDLNVLMKTDTQDELAELAKAMDHMRAQLKVRQMRLHHLSITDSLTQLKNRKFFDEVMDLETNKAARGNYPVSLILIDIDHFKRVNDTHGHLAGDECLRFVSKILNDGIKRSSDVIARYGGEEFAIVLPDTGINESLVIAENIRKTVAMSPISFASITIHLTLSCGISSIIPKSKRSVAELVGSADEALYQAKTEGRNRVKIKTMYESNSIGI